MGGGGGWWWVVVGAVGKADFPFPCEEYELLNCDKHEKVRVVTVRVRVRRWGQKVKPWVRVGNGDDNDDNDDEEEEGEDDGEDNL